MKANPGIEELIVALQQFSRERDWDQYHSLKNLSMALSVEASELVELFQWSTGVEEFADMPEARRQSIRDEVADVFLYLLRFCDRAGIHLTEAAQAKMEKNALKYPK